MSDKKQTSDSANTGIGVAVTKLTPNDPKAPALNGGTAPKGVVTSKQGQ